MGKFQDLTGMKFGMLQVLERVENNNSGKPQFRCRCDCGTEKIICGGSLLSGLTRSCGCLKHAPRFENIVGMKFGRLTVERLDHTKKYKHCTQTYWQCRCECGKRVIVSAYSLKNQTTQSCGCLQREKAAERHKKHGMCGTKIYSTWAGMIQRCCNENCEAHSLYGARGISVCDRWLKFENFYEDVSQLENFGREGYTLDRIDNDKGYFLENVRWATPKQQANNTRKNIKVEYNGVEVALTEAAEKSGVNYRTLKSRYQAGDRCERLFRPVSAGKRCTNLLVEYEGKTLYLKAAAEKAGLPYDTLQKRFHRGDRGEKLFRPVETKHQAKRPA